MGRRWVLACLAGILPGAACDAQVTTDYRGERLLTIRGSVVSVAAPPSAQAALLWWTLRPSPGDGGGDGGVIATAVEAEGAFPAAFTVSIYHRPPDGALFDPAAMPSGATPLEVPAFPGGNLTCLFNTGSTTGTGALAFAFVAAVTADGELVGLADDLAVWFLATSSDYRLMDVDWSDGPDTDGGRLVCGARVARLREAHRALDGADLQIRIPAG